MRGQQLQRHEGPAPTPPAVPECPQPVPAGGNRLAARGPDRLHWAERPWRRLGPEGSIALTSCFGSGHFGRTRMEAPKNTRMEEAATGKSGCSWSERARQATGNGATAAPRPQPPHAPPPALLSLGTALRGACSRHFRPSRSALSPGFLELSYGLVWLLFVVGPSFLLLIGNRGTYSSAADAVKEVHFSWALTVAFLARGAVGPSWQFRKFAVLRSQYGRAWNGIRALPRCKRKPGILFGFSQCALP